MKSILIGLAASLIIASLALGAQKQDQVERQLKAAMNTELVDGNLKAAIEQYKKVAQSGIHSLEAQALIHMAECYQQLGNKESQKIYQTIVSKYADQKDALSLAQARLGGNTTSAKSELAMWTGPSVKAKDSIVSPDGRFITFVDNGALMIHDVAANKDRALTPPASDPQGPAYSVISKDSKQVVYEWWDQNGRAGLRIAELEGSGFLKPRQFFLVNDSVNDIRSFDWSPDGKWIAAAMHDKGKDKTGEIALIAVADGSLQVLKSMDTTNTYSIFFSPDGKYVAYDYQNHVSVLAIATKREIQAVEQGEEDYPVGWSPDGARLLFFSRRSATVSLWAMPFADGKAQGPPEFMKSIGPKPGLRSLGMTTSGALYVHKRYTIRDIAIAPIDLAAGKLLGPPVSFTQGFVDGSHNPQWSPDGKHLAYPASNSSCTNGCVAVRSVATGQVRLLAPTLTTAQLVSWSPDGRSLLTRGTDRSGQLGIFQIDVQSGAATAVILDDKVGNGPQWSADGKKVYFNRAGVTVERDLASGAERDVYMGGFSFLSHDGKYFASDREDASGLLIVPVAGGQPREILHLTRPEVLGQANDVWTPDSNAVIVTKDTGSRKELWLVPITGGQPRKLDIDPNIWRDGSVGGGDVSFSLSWDGHSIAFQMGKPVSEVWALENFLPSPSAKK